MTSTSDGSQAKSKIFLDEYIAKEDKGQKIARNMTELQRARKPDALARTEGGEDQSIKAKVQKGTIKIL